jgi:periplasmic divalent cation tolerance protein
MDESYILILVTAPSREVGEQIAMKLVEERLAACANLVGPIQSTYRWEGVVQKDDEVLLMIKTRSELFELVAECVRQNHPYSVPEVIGVTISQGLPSYLEWIDKETAPREG